VAIPRSVDVAFAGENGRGVGEAQALDFLPLPESSATVATLRWPSLVQQAHAKAGDEAGETWRAINRERKAKAAADQCDHRMLSLSA